MGVIRRGILGGFSNRVGNVVGSSWKGIATMRVLPLSVSNPRTAAQINVRENFSGITKLASALLTSIVKPLNDRFAVRMSGYNLFIQRNKNAFQNDGTFVPREFTLSHGRLSAPVISYVAEGVGDVEVKWSVALTGSMDLASDKVFVVVLDSVTGAILGTSSAARERAEGEITINIEQTDNDLAVYVAFLRADGTEVSPSSYFL